MAKIILSRPPATDEELWFAIKAFFGIEIPRVSVCAEHVSPFHAVAHAFFSRPPNYAVWYASRGSGKSLALAVLGLVKAFFTEVDVTIIGGSMVQSLNVRNHMAELLAYENAPSWAVDKDLATLITTSSGAKIEPLPASQKTVRGKHPVLQLLDEVDEMELDIYDSSLGQAMPQKTRNRLLAAAAPDEREIEYVVASSTWQNPLGSFTEVIDRARKNNMPIFSWCISSGTLVVTGRGEVPIETVRTTDRVWTRSGWKPVQHVTRMGAKPTIALRLSNGRVLRLTPDHLVATPEGWLPAGALVAGSLVLAPTGLAGPVATVGTDVGVLGCELVTAATVGGAIADSPGALDVLRVRDELQVGQVHADGPVAEMVGFKAVRDRADEPEPDGFAGIVGTSVRAFSDAVVAAHGVGPVHAGVGGDTELLPVDLATLHVVETTTSAVLDVYDIGVHDEHEFVAEGIVVHNCWRELIKTPDNPSGWMTQRFIEAKKKTVSAQMWRTEYELNEPSGESRAFDLDQLEKVFVPYPRPIRQHHEGEDYHSWTWEDPQPTGSYVVGADWAKEKDYTVIPVVRRDIFPYRLVKLIRINRRPYPFMIELFNRAIQAYSALGEHDKTGLGNVVNDLVDYSDSVRGFDMVGRNRTKLLTDYITDVEHLHYRLPTDEVEGEFDADDNPVRLEGLEWLKKSHRGATVADVFAPAKWDDHLPDDVAAMALLHRALKRFAAPITEETEVPRTDQVRKVDEQFHTKPYGDGAMKMDGGVTVLDDLVESGAYDLSVPSRDGGTGLWSPES